MKFSEKDFTKALVETEQPDRFSIGEEFLNTTGSTDITVNMVKAAAVVPGEINGCKSNLLAQRPEN